MSATSTDSGPTDDQQNFTNQEHGIINVPSDPDPRSVNEAMVSDHEHKLNIPSTSYLMPPSPPQRPKNLPCADLYNGCRKDYINFCVPLYHASVNCDWQAAEAIFKEKPELVRCGITQNLETPLHVAVTTKSTEKMIEFVKNLVDWMSSNDLELENRSYDTAFALAAMYGNVQGAKIMVMNNRALPDIPGNNGLMPLQYAASCGKYDMVRYLYDNSHKMLGDNWNFEKRAWVLEKCIQADMFDVALKIVMDCIELTMRKSTCRELLYALAQKPDAFNTRKQTSIQGMVDSITSYLKVGFVEKDSDALTLLRIIWGAVMNMPKTDIDDILKGNATVVTPYKEKYSSRILFVATKMGNTEFVIELLRGYPDLIWKQNDSGHNIIHVAVKHRHEDIFNLVHELPGSMKQRITRIKDKNDNNMLHLVGQTSGKIQRKKKGTPMLLLQEFLWYKEVEKLLPPQYRERKNFDGKTPHKLFLDKTTSEWDESLLWADYGSVVATLIIALSFAAGITVPGGFNQSNGIPIFVDELLYSVFAVADAISLFTSTISVIAFLSIVVFRRGVKEQYLEYVPTSMTLGLIALLVSLLAMMVTFSASLFLLCHKWMKWVLMSIIACATLTILMYVSTQSPLFMEVLRTINSSRRLFKDQKRRKLT